jgi:hypothetical protein
MYTRGVEAAGKRTGTGRLRAGRAAAFLLAGALACTSIVPPRTRVLGPIDPSSAPLLYVTTTAERENVVADLKLAGFSVTSDAREASAVLVVRLGGVRATRDCGSLRNVVYEVRQVGVRVAVIKGRGWLGSCSPSILRDMNAALAQLFGYRVEGR